MKTGFPVTEPVIIPQLLFIVPLVLLRAVPDMLLMVPELLMVASF